MFQNRETNNLFGQTLKQSQEVQQAVMACMNSIDYLINTLGTPITHYSSMNGEGYIFRYILQWVDKSFEITMNSKSEGAGANSRTRYTITYNGKVWALNDLNVDMLRDLIE